MEALGILLLVLSIPLTLRWIPQNRLYGFRTAATYRDRSVWDDVNAAAGRQMLALGAVMVALEFALPAAVRVQALRFVGLVGVPAIVVVNWRRAQRLDRQRRPTTPAT
jgi:uncharacterized membrane protein